MVERLVIVLSSWIVRVLDEAAWGVAVRVARERRRRSFQRRPGFIWGYGKAGAQVRMCSWNEGRISPAGQWTLVFVDCQLRWEEGKMKGSTKSAEMDEPFKCRDDTRRLGYVLFESGATGA
jgi:hypothetical protein